MAYNSDLDVMVHFFARWHSGYHEFGHVYSALADSFSSTDTVIIAELDAEQHSDSLPTDCKVTGFPSLCFFPAGKDVAPWKYDGALTLTALESFVDRNSRARFISDIQRKAASKSRKRADAAEARARARRNREKRKKKTRGEGAAEERLPQGGGAEAGQRAHRTVDGVASAGRPSGADTQATPATEIGDAASAAATEPAAPRWKTLRVGSRVRARYYGSDEWFGAQIKAARKDGTFDVVYEDGETETGMNSADIEAIPPPCSSEDMEIFFMIGLALIIRAPALADSSCVASRQPPLLATTATAATPPHASSIPTPHVLAVRRRQRPMRRATSCPTSAAE